ncbi:tail fiber protein [Phyllobacterium sp. SB3]|uniref:phage tail protein n=1 Tax=Phyllobacterium sp. SB3 TaxID=3156073 RepID=UPI0032AEE46D
MSTPYVGEIRMFGFSRVPNGWFACDGSLKSIAEYEVLFMLIGTTYGGDGQVTFAVPNLTGRVPMHWGRGPGLSTYVPGQSSGSENVTLLSTQMPAHNHTMLATTGLAANTSVGTSVELGALNGDTMYATDITGAGAATTSPASTQSTGGNTGHDNTMPTLTAQFCIAWAGIFPQQS